MPPFSPKNPAIKSSVFLSPSFQSSTFLRVCVRRVLGSGASSWSCFCGLGALFLLYRGETDAGFLGGGGFGFFFSGPAFLFCSRLPPSSSPFLLFGAGSGFPSFVHVCLLAGQRPHEEGRCGFCLPVRSFCSALSARAGLPLPCPLSFFFLSLSLRLFLSCMHLIWSGHRDGDRLL